MGNKTEVMDERQKQINCQAMANAYIFTAICLVASMIYKIVTVESLGWEFWAILGACLVTIITRRVMGDVEEPKSIGGKPLPTGNSKADRRVRKLDYLWDSLIFAAACTVLDVVLMCAGENDLVDMELTKLLFPGLEPVAAVVITAVMAFVITFLISYLFDYCLGEFYTVRRYNKMIASMDDDEEE